MASVCPSDGSSLKKRISSSRCRHFQVNHVKLEEPNIFWYLKWRNPHYYISCMDVRLMHCSFPTPKIAGYKIYKVKYLHFGYLKLWCM